MTTYREMTCEQRRAMTAEQKKSVADYAKRQAKKFLSPGMRFRVTKCPGNKRWATFSGWDGNWIVSKSGINDYHPICVDMVGDKYVDFTQGWVIDDVASESVSHV